jgi:hypothetical protein
MTTLTSEMWPYMEFKNTNSPINDNNDNVQNQNAFNLNVNMNLSPVNDNGRNDENMNINPENTCYLEVDGDEKTI